MRTTNIQNINITSINTSMLSWSKTTGHINTDRRRVFNLFKNMSENQTCICTNIWDGDGDGDGDGDVHENEDEKKIPEYCKNIKKIKRIGSSSMAAEVYLLNIDGHEVVGKIMPITSEADEKNNITEIKFAIEASNLVVDKKSQFFPIIYASGHCEDTKFFKGSKFQESSDLYSYRAHIRNQLPDRRSKLRFMASTRNFTKDQLIETYGKTYDQNYKISSDILLDELAWGDLNQFLETKPITPEMSNIIINQVFLAINDVQTKLNAVHNDLHLGNILMLLSKTPDNVFLTCLIHDFGKTEKIENWNSKNRTEDYIKFIYSLLQNDNISSEIKDKLNNLYNNVVKSYSGGEKNPYEIINTYYNSLTPY